MSQTIDNRIVEMQFENKQFESGVQESLSTLDKLKNSLKFDDASKNLQDFSKNVNKNMDLSGLSKSVEGLSDKFSASGIAGMEAIRKLTDFAIEAGKTMLSALDAPFKQIREGGWKRAMNIEDAKFQLKGVGVAWESVADDINFAVADTAYGLDAAAKAASQLAASGIKAGEGMKAALRGISGVAAMGNTEYENITDIFTKAAGNGKVMAQELNRVSQYGINARAEIVKFFNDVNSGAEKLTKYEEESGIIIPEAVKKNVKAITKGNQLIEADLAGLVKKGKLDFQSFSYAMDYAFGKHAKDANETFMGALRNIKAALSKIGAEFATPLIKNAIPVLNQVRLFVNELKKAMGPVYEIFANFTKIVSDSLVNKIQRLRNALFNEWDGLTHLWNAFKNVVQAVVTVFAGVKSAFDAVFPPTKSLGESVYTVTKNIESFTSKLIMSESTLMGFRNVMVIIFNVIKMIGTVLKNILPIITKVVGIIAKAIAVVIGIIGYLTQLVFNLTSTRDLLDDIRKSGGVVTFVIDKLKSAFAYLKDVLSDTTTVTGRFFAKLKEAATIAAYIVASGLYLGFMKIKEVLSYFDGHDPLGSLIKGVTSLVDKLEQLPVIKTVIRGIETAFGAITKVLETLVKLVMNFVNELRDGKSILEALGSTLSIVIGGAITLFETLYDKVKSLFSMFQKEKVIEENVEMPIYGANGAMVGFVQTLSKTEGEVDKTTSAFDKAKSSVVGFGVAILDKIKNMQASKVILAAYAGMLLLIAYNSNELIKALGGLTRKLSGGIFNIFTKNTTKLEKFKIAMVSITGAIAVLAGAIYMLKDVPVDQLDKITNSLLKLIGLVGGLSLLSTVLTTFATRFTGVQGFAGFSTNMIALSAGVVTMIYALKLLESVNMEGVWKRVAILGTIAAGLMTVSIITAKLAPQLTVGSLFMVAFAGSTLMLVKALDQLSHVNLQAIQDNWEGLAIVIASFGVFAALAGTVGISSTVSLIAFLLGMRVVLANFEAIRDKLIEYKFGDILASFFAKLRDGIKGAIEYGRSIYNSLSEFDKIMLAVYTAISSGGLFLVLFGISKAANYIKKAALSATIFAASIAALMYATYKIAEACKTISPEAITSAQRILFSVGGLLLAVIAVTAAIGGEGTEEKTDVTGWFGKKKTGKSKVSKNKSNSLKQVRKMLLDMGILLASVALFVNVVGKMKPEELAQAEQLLWKVMGFFAGLEITVTLIAAFSRNTAGMASSMAAFIGTIALIGTLLGSFVILMNYFKDYTFDKDGIIRLGVVLGILAAGVTAVLKFLKAIKGVGKKGDSYKSVLAFGAVLGVLGIVISELMDVIKTKDDLIRAGEIAGGLAIFLGIMVTLVGILESVTKKTLTTVKRQNAFTKALIALGSMVGAIVALAITFSALRNVDSGRMALQATIITLTLAAITGIVIAIQHFMKNKHTSLTKKTSDDLKTTMKMLIGFFIAFEALAITFASMRNVDSGRMALQATIITLTFAALSAIVLAIQHFSKNKYTSLTPTSSKNMKQTMVLLASFFVAFEALAITFSAMRNVDAGRMAGQAATMVLTLAALSAIALGVAAFVKNVKPTWGDLSKSAAMITGMIAIFAALSLVFKYIISDLPDATGMLAKSQTIMLALTELVGLMALCGVIGKMGVKNLALGEVGLLGMIGLFYLLTKIFAVIDGLQTKGIMAKSQTMILVMTELIALIALMGVLVDAGGILILGGVAELALWPMINLFGSLAEIFTIINGMKTDGVMAKSQTMILVMTELIALIALMGGLVYAAGDFILGGLAELALWPMINLFGLLTDAFVIIDGMKTDGILAKSQTIILVMTELVALIALMGALIGFMIAGGISELALWPMVGIFGKLTEIFVLIDGMKTEGLLAKSQAIILVLLELEGLSVLSILSIIALAGGPGLDAMVDIFGKLTTVFMMIDQMHLEGLEEKAGIIVATLLKLEGLAALGGLVGGIFGGGLLLLAEGIAAIGSACASVGAGVTAFGDGIERLSTAIKSLTVTGPGIISWFTSLSVGITTITMAISNSVMTISVTVVAAVNTLIVGIATAIRNGKAVIFGEAASLGDTMKKGLSSRLDPLKWGSELVSNFANGIRSGLGGLAKAADDMARTIWSYIHFSDGAELSYLKAGNVFNWGSEIPQQYGMGIDSGLPGLGTSVDGIGSVVSGGIDKIIEYAKEGGAGFINTLVNTLSANDPALKAKLNGYLEMFGIVKNEYASLNAQVSKFGSSIRDEQYRKNTVAIGKLQDGIKKAKHEMKDSSKVVAEYNKQIETLEAENRSLLGVVEETTPAIEDYSNALTGVGDAGKGAKEKTKEIKDEIADFYDSIQGAINLFEEFNKETELTSDKLLENMRSQIAGVSEWADQIQKLAFMGIDQGLLQQLADMGPQGYEYTNAFVHMTAEQLAEANNLYHQSLMLPSKITSQVYGSYAVAGRSAASGFLQGMSQEDIKSAAVNFAHDVVDQMNLALDIVSGKSMVTYEDGVAVVNGVRTGMSAPYVKQNLDTAIKLLSDNNIKEGFNKGLFGPGGNSEANFMYQIGTNITKGIAKGVEDKKAVEELTGAIVRVSNAGQDACAKSNKIESPSKVFARFGRFITLGLAKGITDETQSAVNAMTTTSETIIDTMRDTLNKANEALVDGVDDPVIKPVLDLSNIQDGSRQLNNMLSRNSAFSASSSFGRLQNEQWNNQTALLNATMDNTDVVSAISTLNDEVTTLKDVMANIKVVLDTGTMVGAMTPAIDQQLGVMQVYAGRGI